MSGIRRLLITISSVEIGSRAMLLKRRMLLAGCPRNQLIVWLHDFVARVFLHDVLPLMYSLHYMSPNSGPGDRAGCTSQTTRWRPPDNDNLEGHDALKH